MVETKILNSEGKAIILNDQEEAGVRHWQTLANALGFQVDITTLTAISKKVSQQKLYEVEFAKYVPVVIGEGAWSTDITTYLAYSITGDFQAGVINTGGGQDRLASADAAISAVSVPVVSWAKSIDWSIPQLMQAARAGNWDLVTQKEIARKKSWDLGLQRVAFLGLDNTAGVGGLYGQSGVTIDSTTLPQPISTLAPTDLKAFCQNMLKVYRANCAYTAMPSIFIVPESDYLGMAGASNADFPLKSVLDVLMETFRTMTGNQNFQILPSAYGMSANNGGSGYDNYLLLNYDETSVAMKIPVDFTNTMANTLNGFQFQSAAYGQFTGVKAFRPLEMYQFRITTPS